jgi:RNA polymerase sigma-70 factor (ECF subfamily)
LEEILMRYREPLLQFTICQGMGAEEAEDAVQEFLAHVAHDSVLRRADSDRGRFRSFLLGALKRFLSHRRARETALKRGGGIPAVSVEAEGAERDNALSVSETDTSFFDRQWAVALLNNALEELEQEYSARGRDGLFSQLLTFLPGGQENQTYETGAAAAGMSLGTFKAEVHRARRRLRERLRVEVSLTVAAPHEVEEELSYLGRALVAASS